MVRDCNISTLDGDILNHKCEMTTVQETKTVIDSAMENITMGVMVQNSRDSTKNLSQHLLPLHYWKHSFCGDKYGIHGSCPYDMLHLFYLGIMKYSLKATFNFKKPSKKIAEWHEKSLRGKTSIKSKPKNNPNAGYFFQK